MSYSTSNPTTSPFGNRILAISVSLDRHDLFSGRRLCQDRVPFWHQLGPRRFAKNVRRVGCLFFSFSLLLTSFLTLGDSYCSDAMVDCGEQLLQRLDSFGYGTRETHRRRANYTTRGGNGRQRMARGTSILYMVLDWCLLLLAAMKAWWKQFAFRLSHYVAES